MNNLLHMTDKLPRELQDDIDNDTVSLHTSSINLREQSKSEQTAPSQTTIIIINNQNDATASKIQTGYTATTLLLRNWLLES